MFEGELVQLRVQDASMAMITATWDSDPEFFELWDTDPVVPISEAARKEHSAAARPNGADFVICTLLEGKPIGTIGCNILDAFRRDAFIYIDIGDKDYWGQGYGTDAMRVIVRYCFTALDLHRVSLGVFDHNTRAIRSYEKVGFVREGHRREDSMRDGKRFGSVMMGILRSEWRPG